MNYASIVSSRTTPQTSKIPGSKQVKNHAGGYVFKIDSFQQLERFLILGSEGGTYYVGERDLTIKNSDVLNRCLKEDYRKAIDLIVDVSVRGRAPKNDPAIFALAQASGNPDPMVSGYALSKLNDVCRIGTHLFQFVDAVQHFRGWGRGLRSAVAGWYNGKNDSSLAYQVAKYRNRNGWTHKDVLRLCHAMPASPAKSELFKWIIRQDTPITDSANAMIAAMEAINRATNRRYVLDVITEYKLTWEMVPTQWLADPVVWEALLPNTKLNALIRNLGRLTSNGCLKPLSGTVDYVVERLTDAEAIKRERLHPMSTLIAAKQYATGRGLKGSLSWSPVPQISNALESTFQFGFAAVEPTNKKFLYGIDVSGSMSYDTINNTTITPREAAACLALVAVKTEPKIYTHGFSHRFVDLSITASDNLGSVVRKTSNLPFERTDCAIPMQYATQMGLDVDAFVVLTDNETYAGSEHPVQALRKYRQSSGKDAKLIVVGMTSTGFSIADPNDAGSLDVVGFDTTVPEVIANFVGRPETIRMRH